MAENPDVESSLREPTTDEVRTLSQRMGLAIREEEISVYQEAIANTLRDTYQRLYDLPEPRLPIKYARERGYRPAPEENPFNAWYWRCNIVGAPNGKLQGKTIAIKDNISVAGVPMMCGSRMLEDYVPDYDATVVSSFITNITACRRKNCRISITTL